MMKRSRKFENILDECLERLLVNGETVEQCLQSYPEQAGELKPLLETALVAIKASAIQPRPEFRDKARYQFQLALQETEHKKSRPFFSWQPRWAMAVAVILVLLLAGSGTVVAASRSMPDDFLYPVKLATEQVQLLLTPSALGKAELYAKLADRRVVEIVNMANENKPEQIELTARRLDAHLAEIANLASTQEVMAGEAAMAPTFEKATAPEDTLEAEEATEAEEEVVLPPEPPPVTIEEPSLVSERALEGAEVDTEVDSWAKLRATVRSYAINHPARLRALLETVPPSVRPALLRAIALSETGYEKALEALE